MVEIPNSSVDRIIRKGGAYRVSKSAIEILQQELEEYGIRISELAVEIAMHAKKKTVEGDDIRLAIRKLTLG
ncbi:MAG: histone family protein [Candidatus Heimdallarchaeota archaeon]